MASKTEARTIGHALFWYADPADPKVEKIGRRGDTVDLLEADIARGEANGAFTEAVGDVPAPHGSLPEFPVEGSGEEQKNWVAAGKVDEIVDAVNANPSIAAAVMAAEESRGDDARTTLLASLAKVVGQH